MSISVNVSELLGRRNNTLNGTGISQSGSTSGNILSSKKSGNNIVITVSRVCETSKVKRGNQPKLSIAAIAKKIAQGKKVTQEERNFLKKNDPITYRKAETANRLRIKLEEALNSAKSETAKAMAVAEVSAEATTFAQMDAKGEDSDTCITGAELYSDAIEAALSKFGSKKLNEELKPYTKINDNSSVQDEEKVDDQGISEDVVEENSSLEEESSNYLLEE